MTSNSKRKTKTLPMSAPLSDHRDLVRERIEAGESVRCPLCTQNVKVYNRTIYRGMVISLARIYRAGGITEAAYAPVVVGGRGRAEGKLAYWDLLEDEGSRRADGGRTGYWFCTSQGEAFLHGKITLPRYAHVYDGKRLGLSNYHYDYRQNGGSTKVRYKTTPVDVHEAYGTPFSLAEIM